MLFGALGDPIKDPSAQLNPVISVKIALFSADAANPIIKMKCLKRLVINKKRSKVIH